MPGGPGGPGGPGIPVGPRKPSLPCENNTRVRVAPWCHHPLLSPWHSPSLPQVLVAQQGQPSLGSRGGPEEESNIPQG